MSFRPLFCSLNENVLVSRPSLPIGSQYGYRSDYRFCVLLVCHCRLASRAALHDSIYQS